MGTYTRGRPRRADPVDAGRAREVLQAALESWKRGEPPEALRKRSPPITVQDMDWEAGSRLVDFRVVGAGQSEDANLRCPVRLTLRDPQGRATEKSVTYLVGTSPVPTVFRELFH